MPQFVFAPELLSGQECFRTLGMKSPKKLSITKVWLFVGHFLPHESRCEMKIPDYENKALSCFVENFSKVDRTDI